MKRFFVSMFLLGGLNLNANFWLIGSIDGYSGEHNIYFDTSKKEEITKSQYDSLIFKAEHKEGTNYLFAQVPTKNGMKYFDGKMTHELYKKNKLDPYGKKTDAINYFILTRYENQKTFRYFTSEQEPNVDTFFSANDGNLDDLLTIGKKLAEQGQTEIARDLLIRAWRNGWYLTQWEAYQGIEKIIFPEKPEDNFSLFLQKVFMGYHFLKDILWP